MGNGLDVEVVPQEEEQERSTESTKVDLKVPHLVLDRDELIQALSAFKLIGSISGSNLISKAVHIKLDNGRLIINGNNKDVYLTSYLEVKNTENVLDANFVIMVDDLDLLVRRGYKNIVIYQPDSKSIAVQVLGGELYLDTQLMGEFLFTRPPSSNVVPLPVDIGRLSDLVSIMGNSMKLAIRPEDRKVMVKGGVALGSYIIAAVRVAFGEIPDMILRSVDLAFLYRMLPNNKKVVISLSGDRLKFAVSSEIGSGGFSYTSLRASGIPDATFNDLAESFSKPLKGSATTSTTEFKSIVSLFSNLSNSSGTVDLTTVSGDLSISYLTKSGKTSIFKIGLGCFEGIVKIQIESLMKALSIMIGKDNVEIGQIDGGIVLSDSTGSVLLGTQ